MHTDTDKTIVSQSRLMRGSCGSERWSRSLINFERVYSRVTMILSSEDRFHNRPKDVSIDVEER